MISVTRAEVCAVACAELFRDAGEIMVSPMANMVSIGARLARLTFSPDIVLTDDSFEVLTPPDVVSQLALAVPMCLLYEIGIIAARYFVKHSRTPADSTDLTTRP